MRRPAKRSGSRIQALCELKEPCSVHANNVNEDGVSRDEDGSSIYESVKDIIGSVEGCHDPTLSENTGRKFTELLQARYAKRQS